jgi:hypothetical protein
MYDTTSYDTTAPLISSGMMTFIALFSVALLVFLIVSLWKVFTKAGQPGWSAIVPIYNTYILLKIVGRPVWWLLLFFIPLVNYVIPFILGVDLAKSFKKSTVFGIVALGLVSPVGYAILAFGKSQYGGPSVAAPVATVAPVAGPTPPPAAAA